MTAIAYPPSPEQVDLALPALTARGIGKRFADVVAADDIDIDVRCGEILAVLGENGAGKSTLMKMLYGYYQPDAGQLTINGRDVHLRSPSDARDSHHVYFQ